MSDAADQLVSLVLDRLTTLDAINQNTRECERPINVGPIQRWIDDLRQQVIRFNLKAITVPPNPIFPDPNWAYDACCGKCPGGTCYVDAVTGA